MIRGDHMSLEPNKLIQSDEPHALLNYIQRPRTPRNFRAPALGQVIHARRQPLLLLHRLQLRNPRLTPRRELLPKRSHDPLDPPLPLLRYMHLLPAYHLLTLPDEDERPQVGDHEET
jgi:hypothetical protein